MGSSISIYLERSFIAIKNVIKRRRIASTCRPPNEEIYGRVK